MILRAVMFGVSAAALAAGAELVGREPSEANPAGLVQAWLGLKLEDQVLRPAGGPRLQVVVREVKTNSAAAKAGVQAGDLVVFVEDQLVSRIQDVVTVLKHVAPGSLVSLDLLRAGRPVMVAVKIAAP